MVKRLIVATIAACVVFITHAVAAPPLVSGGPIIAPIRAAPTKAAPAALFQPSSAVPFVDNVTTTARCASNNQSVDVAIVANLVVPSPTLGGTDKPLVYIWINDEALPPVVGTIYNVPATIDAPKTGVSVSLEKSFSGLGGNARVQFSIGPNGPRSTSKAVSYSCANLVAAGSRPDIGTVTLPNFKALPIVAIVYRPPIEMSNPNPGPRVCIFFNDGCWEQRVSLGTPVTALIETDLSRTLPVHRILGGRCPSNGDAFVTVRIAIAIEMKGTNLDGYVGESYYRDAYPYQGSPVLVQGGRVLDSRAGRRTGISNLPDGYEWAFFDKVVQCATDTVITYKIDPENKLSESDETDNEVRFRISTIVP